MPLHRNGRYKKLTGPTPFWGTLQNPEAHKNSMSREEAEAWSQREFAKRQAANEAAAKQAAELELQRLAAEKAKEAARQLAANLPDLLCTATHLAARAIGDA